MIGVLALLGLMFALALGASALTGARGDLETDGMHEFPELDPAASTTRGVIIDRDGRSRAAVARAWRGSTTSR